MPLINKKLIKKPESEGKDLLVEENTDNNFIPAVISLNGFFNCMPSPVITMDTGRNAYIVERSSNSENVDIQQLIATYEESSIFKSDTTKRLESLDNFKDETDMLGLTESSD